MTISTKGLYLPISVIVGNDIDFSFEFIIDGVQQQFNDYTFVGGVSDSTGFVVESFNFAINALDPNLIDVSMASTQTRFPVGEYHYEIKAVTIVGTQVSTLLRGNFNMLSTFVGV